MYILSVYVNIIYVSNLTSNGYEFHFMNGFCHIYLKNKLTGTGYIKMAFIMEIFNPSSTLKNQVKLMS